MKKDFLLWVFAVVLTACSTSIEDDNLIEGDKSKLKITVQYSQVISGKTINTPDDGSTVYLFEKFEARELVGGSFVNKYDYLGNGVFEHKETKVKVNYSKKAAAQNLGIARFNSVPQATHTIAVDSRATGKTDWITINTQSSNTHKFTFNK